MADNRTFSSHCSTPHGSVILSQRLWDAHACSLYKGMPDNSCCICLQCFQSKHDSRCAVEVSGSSKEWMVAALMSLHSYLTQLSELITAHCVTVATAETTPRKQFKSSFHRYLIKHLFIKSKQTCQLKCLSIQTWLLFFVTSVRCLSFTVQNNVLHVQRLTLRLF